MTHVPATPSTPAPTASPVPRRPSASRLIRIFVGLAGSLCLALVSSCSSSSGISGGGSPGGSTSGPLEKTCTAAENALNTLVPCDVSFILQTAAASVNVPLALAVTDRSGNLLGIYLKANAPAIGTANFSAPAPADEVAIALARSTSFFSNDQAPISSRTIRFISASHFPPGIMFTESGPLYGIENTNRGCGFQVNYLPGQGLPIPTLFHQPTRPGLGILTGIADLLDTNNLAVNPGGVPIFKNGHIAGGIGVVADPATPNYNAVVEFAGVAATVANGYAPNVPAPGAVLVNGFALPFVDQTTLPAGPKPGAADGTFEFLTDTRFPKTPELDLIAETGSTQGGLTVADVNTIIQNTLATAYKTRAVIRLPEGARARFAISIADLDGHLLALYRMPDATMFSTDVSVGKARNVIYFSSVPNVLPGLPTGTAVTNRTIGFAGQPFFPSGIDGSDPGPFFDLFKFDVANPCTQGPTSPPPNPNANVNGIVFFPGAAPLYKDGKLVGGLGVSGDGVDQDDFVAAAGSAGFEAPQSIRADNFLLRGVRLPYQKFPRNPEN